MDVKLQEKPSALKREYQALQIMNFFSFLFSWVIFTLQDPNPEPQH